MQIRSLLGYVAVLGAIATQFSCAPENSSLFPSRFESISPDNFEFTADGTFKYPANTKSGEAGRLSWLSGFISQHKFCPAGYDITERNVDYSKLSPKHSDQTRLAITYYGRCKAPSQ
jgi:hypothetical protein